MCESDKLLECFKKKIQFFFDVSIGLKQGTPLAYFIHFICK